MLSVAKTPSDPSCSCQFPHELNATTGNPDDNKSSHQVAPLDLIKPQQQQQPHRDLDLDLHHKFSIRDYVFTSRNKDIKKNWPFSLKNLQLCLKHGVKEVLPPFQTHTAVKTRSPTRCTVETEKISVDNFDVEPSERTSKIVLVSSGNARLNDKLENACVGTSSCQLSAGENDFPSTTTSVSHSEIESVPSKRPSSLSVETDTFLSASASATVEVRAASHHSTAIHKTENINRAPGKKCRLIVKFSNNSDRCSTEDIASNSTAVSETMASKVCPVCKTFTSSSNTTLNAHIDQCLSAESTPKWTADSRPSRHRIKPRKTRMMVDVYATAKHCTLEELDRRNGTSWAAVSSLPNQDTQKLEMTAEWNRRRVLQVHPEDAGDVGEVYIDSNGTKVRILSKSNDAPTVSKEFQDSQQKSPLKEEKGIKFLPKKKQHARKHLKYLKLGPQSRKFFSQKTRASQICGGEDGDYGVEEGDKKEKHQIQKQMKTGDSGALRQWVCSKRTGLTKTVNNQDNGQMFRSKRHLPRHFLVDSERSSLGESSMEGNHNEKYADVSQKLLSSPGTNGRVEKPVYAAQISDKWVLSSWRKRVGGPLLGDNVNNDMERSRPPMRQNSQLNRDSPMIHSNRTLHVSSLANNRDGYPEGLVDECDIPPSDWMTPSVNSQEFASTSLRPISKKNSSSVFQSKPYKDKKRLAGKKIQLDLIGSVDEEVAAGGSAVDQQNTLMHKGGKKEITDKTSFSRGIGQQIIEDRVAISTSKGEAAMALESSEPVPQFYGHDDGENTDPSARYVDDITDKVDDLDAYEDAVATMSTKFKQLSDRSKSCSNSFEDYSGLLCGGEALARPTEPSFVNGQEIDSSNEAGNGMIGQNDDMRRGLDSDIENRNSFPEVDPIPIPGPPGSFLPSPRDMGSDDFQGNSSLTTSRVQSSHDQLDFVDGDPSDSPISVASTISNSTEARPDFNYSEPLSSVGARALQDKMKSDFSTAGTEPMLERAAVVDLTGMGTERYYFDKEIFKVNKISIEKGSLSFKNDGQPCCCQRKERISQDDSPNYHESQLLKRRTMTSMTVPAMVKQILRPNNLDVRPDILSLGDRSSVESGKGVPPIMKSTAGSIPVKSSPEAGVKFSGHSDCDSPSPSTPNPILRLMGKNLMVVNREEDASVPLGQSHLSTQNSHAIPQWSTSSPVSPRHMQHQERHYFPQMVPQGPVIFTHNSYDAARQSLDVRPSSSFRNQTYPRTPVMEQANAVSGLFPNHHINGGFATSIEPHIYEEAYSLSGRHDPVKIRPSETSSCSVGNVLTSLDRQRKIEASVSGDLAIYSEGLRASQLMSSSTVPNLNTSMHVNPFSCYQAQDHHVVLGGESPAVHNFPAISSMLPNVSPARWVYTQEGSSSAMHRSTAFMVAPPSVSHMRSGPYYYSPSLS